MTDSSTHLSIDRTDRALIAVVRTEKIGAREAEIVESELKAAAPSRQWRIAIDLSDVAMLASMGLGMLVTMHKQCNEQGGKLAIYGVRPEIATLLKITHLERVLKISSDRDAALKVVS